MKPRLDVLKMVPFVIIVGSASIGYTIIHTLYITDII